jgi:hypothetical protein
MNVLRFSNALAGIALAAMLPAAAQMAAPTPMTLQQYTEAGPGANVRIVVRVDSAKRQTVAATVLARKSESLYSQTAQHVTLYVASGTPIVMGTVADLKGGAVVFVDGIVTRRGHVDVKEAIVFTPYAKVE